MNAGLSFMHKFSSAYTAACKPLCHALHLPQTAFDILTAVWLASSLSVGVGILVCKLLSRVWRD